MEGEKIGLLAVGIAATISLIYFLFVDWIWRPVEFEWGFYFRTLLSGIVVAITIGVEIVVFRWLFSRR